MIKDTFKDKVLKVVAKIPKGKVLTYGDVSLRAGVQGGARAVGNIMSKNKDKNIPCHRVVKSDGSIGHYNGLQTKGKAAYAKATASQGKSDLLKKEGVKFTKSGKIIFHN